MSGWQRLLFEAPKMHQAREDLDVSSTSLAGSGWHSISAGDEYSLARKLQ